ncbi:WXG100 family type VII secretion target [Vallitalea pronyensis]|uniref:WXG100 family type VII secretion target n=1 Tax=Vallitalea pronyensis TaxID=1348613 RepID=A0A8J8MPN0_9FIRM|nr:WXG100 family type VII secretion target [Vallitalea pronyensis]QUI25083.1 WXG100 family type VII secretion target [Vallitalea pronyensis]
MAQFIVTPGTLTTVAGNIRSIDGQFLRKMEEIEQHMNRLKAKWDSEAANGFINKFKGLRENFDNYSKVIQSYALFLEKAAEEYGKTDKKINNATSNLFA